MAAKRKNICSLILNAFIIINMIFCVRSFFVSGTEGNMTGSGWVAFRYYTIESNVFCAIACIVVLFFNIKSIGKERLEMPGWALVLKFAGTVAVTVTFIVVAVFLGNVFGYDKMYGGANLYMHGLNAVAALVGLLLFERGLDFPKKKFIWGLASVFVYGTVYLVMVMIVKAWPDFYGFATVLRWWFSYPAMMALGYFLSKLIWRLYTGKK